MVVVQQLLGYKMAFCKAYHWAAGDEEGKSFVSLLLISAACPPCSDDHIRAGSGSHHKHDHINAKSGLDRKH